MLACGSAWLAVCTEQTCATGFKATSQGCSSLFRKLFPPLFITVLCLNTCTRCLLDKIVITEPNPTKRENLLLLALETLLLGLSSCKRGATAAKLGCRLPIG